LFLLLISSPHHQRELLKQPMDSGHHVALNTSLQTTSDGKEGTDGAPPKEDTTKASEEPTTTTNGGSEVVPEETPADSPMGNTTAT
jgi:hypothetical protein